MLEVEKPKSLEIKIISSPEEIIKHEARRVKYYLGHKKDYAAPGISINLRFPKGIEEHDQVEDLVRTEYDCNNSLYHQFQKELAVGAEQLLNIVGQVSNLYGFPIHGIFEVMPTAYGTVGSACAYGEEGPTVFRIPELRPPNLGNGFTTGHYRTTLELLFHELFAHRATLSIRRNTPIDDLVERVTHQQHKEYLMDLLGLTSLSESGLMSTADISMQKKAIDEARVDIDPLYFTENGISWRGKLPNLIEQITSKVLMPTD